MNRLSKLIVLSSIILIASVNGFAEESTEEPAKATEQAIQATEEPVEEPSGALDVKSLVKQEALVAEDAIAKVFIYLALFGACAAVVLYLVKKSSWVPSRGKKGSSLKIKETHVLGNKQFLVVVEFESKKILLGVGPGMIKNLANLNFPHDEVKTPIDDSAKIGQHISPIEKSG